MCVQIRLTLALGGGSKSGVSFSPQGEKMNQRIDKRINCNTGFC